jgi:hypothetical protein
MTARAVASQSTLEQVAPHSTFGATILWSSVLASEWFLSPADGVICGEPVALLGHCTLCWPAAVLTAISAVSLALAFRSFGRRA